MSIPSNLRWRCRDRSLDCGSVQVMGVVNVTPDSFSDGGRFLAVESALNEARRLIADGADLVDVGGESTRPGASEVSAEEEIRRVVPVIEALAREISIPISIDTRKSAVAAAALAAGAHLVNDVGAFRADDSMVRVVAEFRAGYVAMHMQGTPDTMQVSPRYHDVVGEIADGLAAQLDRLAAGGVDREQVVLDPGIGFGKTLTHNLDLLRNLQRIVALGRPVLIGISRKSFLGKILDRGVDSRLSGAIAGSLWAAEAGVRWIRTHDVRETKDALKFWNLLKNPGTSGGIPTTNS